MSPFTFRYVSTIIRVAKNYSFDFVFAVPAASRQSPNTDILRFVEDPNYAYEDFLICQKKTSPDQPDYVPTFRAEDFKWEEQGFSLVNRLYSDIGDLLEAKFKTAADLTYYT